MLREVADLTGLIENVTEVLADTYKGPWVHDPGRVFADLAVAVADGADCVSGIAGTGRPPAPNRAVPWKVTNGTSVTGQGEWTTAADAVSGPIRTSLSGGGLKSS